jgi:hypothetical protein
MGIIYLTPLLSILLILLGVAIVFFGSAPQKLLLERLPEKAPSGFVQPFLSRIRIQGVPVNHIPIIVEPLLASMCQVFLPVRGNVRFCVDSLLYGKTVLIHNKIETWGFGGRGIVRGYRKCVLVFDKTCLSRYRNDLRRRQ